jgi:ADP-ribose pyrophosphatase YjhB (NUDIX family)
MSNDFQAMLATQYPAGKEIGDYKVVGATIAYQTPYIAVAIIEVSKNSKTETFSVILTQNGAGALAVTKNKEVVLVRHDRLAAQTTNWEIPQETLVPSEDPLTGALRAVTEELGYAGAIISQTKLPFLVHAAPHRLTEQTTVYLMIIDTYEAARAIDQDEIAEVKLFTLPEIKTMLSENEITEAVTVASLEWLLTNEPLI